MLSHNSNHDLNLIHSTALNRSVFGPKAVSAFMLFYDLRSETCWIQSVGLKFSVLLKGCGCATTSLGCVIRLYVDKCVCIYLGISFIGQVQGFGLPLLSVDITGYKPEKK